MADSRIFRLRSLTRHTTIHQSLFPTLSFFAFYIYIQFFVFLLFSFARSQIRAWMRHLHPFLKIPWIYHRSPRSHLQITTKMSRLVRISLFCFFRCFLWRFFVTNSWVMWDNTVKRFRKCVAAWNICVNRIFNLSYNKTKIFDVQIIFLFLLFVSDTILTCAD